MTSHNDSALELYGVGAQLGPILGRTVADAATTAARDVPDARPAERRLEAERRRTCRQASRALDRMLVDETAYSPDGARVRRVLDTAERDQEFYRLAGAWLADINRALSYADPDEIRARVDAMAAALRRTQSRSVA
ncbi:hypothetical protein [Nocardia jinanensis]|uniref:Uncharacterized protein n=1 Tax=Nocardia jinanensis TaxID=382504 RepID=A0A917VSC1_9NOCA|nr:hypothetical protein [Nocardia jinanensis]GGL09712.1 hypothetical protein GCM10011588_25140 [Nocardia jinanensis]